MQGIFWLTQYRASKSVTKTDSIESDSSSGPPTSKIQKFLNSLGLGSFYLLFQEIFGCPIVEGKKIAIRCDLWTACSVSLLHIIPTVAAIILIVFNWKGYYIGGELSGPVGEDGLKFLGLQFAAKMLELLAMASLSCVLFALLRYQLVSGHPVPFGAITAGFEFNNLSLLWSKEFIATCGANFRSWRTKLLLITTIILFTLLGATIGPSAAVAALPTLRDWSGGGTVFYLNATIGELWPTQLDTMSPAELSCSVSQNNSCFPSNHNLLADELLSYWPSYWPQTEDYGLSQVMPENTLLSGRHALRKLAIRFRGPFEYQPPITAATIPMAAIGDALTKISRYWAIANTYECSYGKPSFCFYNDISYSVSALQPVTFVRCVPNTANDTLQFPRLDQGLENFPVVEFTNSTIGTLDWFNIVTGNGLNPSLSFVELPSASFGLSSIGAVVALPGINSANIPDQVFSCTVDARWANSTTVASFSGGPLVVSGSPADWFTTGRLQLSNGQFAWTQVNITPEWAQNVNPFIANLNMSAFAMLSNSLGRLNQIANVPYTLSAVESMLAVMLVESMSRTSNMAMIQGTLKGFASNDWMAEILPGSRIFGTGGSAFNYSPTATDQFARLQMKTTVNGYGYGITAASGLATLVLAIYCIVALTFVIYSTFLVRTTSSSWESVSEIVALAMNSTPTVRLRNTGAGISTVGTLEQTVKIGVSDDHLQMIFVGNDFEEEFDKKHIDKVAPNRSYG